MIRYVEQTKANTHRVLSALVGLDSAITVATDAPVGAPAFKLRDGAITFSLFNKFGEAQLVPNEHTKYLLVFSQARIIPLIVDRYDVASQTLYYSPALVKDEHSEKVEVELSRLVEHLKVDADDKRMMIQLDPNEREAEKTVKGMMAQWNSDNNTNGRVALVN